ncbi:MFS transporter [Gordoniibacillus kamchatkensis]|uniref:MFS transporter n=1 Tax=Gordoniibacillus kamchatkensis TaxID=1590651 RepID=UPI000A682F1E|nr:MFS transporter [Paenibacillus sp. VKM B-2647]
MQMRYSLSISGFYFIYFFGYGALFPFLALVLQQNGRFDGAGIGLLLSLNPILSIAFQPLWGLLCDATQKPKAVLGATVWLSVLASASLLRITDFSFAMAAGALAVLAIVQSAAMPLIDSLTMLTPRARANITGRSDYGGQPASLSRCSPSASFPTRTACRFPSSPS